jgi:hypothetical protein
MPVLQCVMLMFTPSTAYSFRFGLHEVAGQHIKRIYYLHSPTLLHFVYTAVKCVNVNFTEIPEA